MTASVHSAKSSKPLPRPSRGAARRLRQALALDDFEALAQTYLPRPIFGYIAGASETNSSLHDNRAAFRELAFLPRTLVNVSRRTQETNLLGVDYHAPFGISPVGFSALSAYRGDLVLARGAARAGIPMIMSGASLIRLEDVAKEEPGSWFQVYLPGESNWILALLDRIEQAGLRTLVLTVDMPVVANRENNVRNGFSAPLNPTLRLAWDGIVRPRWTVKTFLRTLLLHGMPHFENSSVNRGPPIVARNVVRHMAGRDHLDWSHFDLIRRRWTGRLVIKGIMTPADARIALDHGADAIIISNHGGRQLDGMPSPLRVLPSIAQTIAGAIPVMIDSGFRRGSDVLKAIALGANFVFLGRPFIFAAAIAGEAGVAHAFRLLADEIDRDMALLGINSLDEMTPQMLMRIAGPAAGMPPSDLESISR
jgi:L-lactate dehydrogenase (cytochrome)